MSSGLKKALRASFLLSVFTLLLTFFAGFANAAETDPTNLQAVSDPPPVSAADSAITPSSGPIATPEPTSASVLNTQPSSPDVTVPDVSSTPTTPTTDSPPQADTQVTIPVTQNSMDVTAVALPVANTNPANSGTAPATAPLAVSASVTNPSTANSVSPTISACDQGCMVTIHDPQNPKNNDATIYVKPSETLGKAIYNWNIAHLNGGKEVNDPVDKIWYTIPVAPGVHQWTVEKLNDVGKLGTNITDGINQKVVDTAHSALGDKPFPSAMDVLKDPQGVANTEVQQAKKDPVGYGVKNAIEKPLYANYLVGQGVATGAAGTAQGIYSVYADPKSFIESGLKLGAVSITDPNSGLPTGLIFPALAGWNLGTKVGPIIANSIGKVINESLNNTEKGFNNAGQGIFQLVTFLVPESDVKYAGEVKDLGALGTADETLKYSDAATQLADGSGPVGKVNAVVSPSEQVLPQIPVGATGTASINGQPIAQIRPGNLKLTEVQIPSIKINPLPDLKDILSSSTDIKNITDTLKTNLDQTTANISNSIKNVTDQTEKTVNDALSKVSSVLNTQSQKTDNKTSNQNGNQSITNKTAISNSNVTASKTISSSASSAAKSVSSATSSVASSVSKTVSSAVSNTSSSVSSVSKAVSGTVSSVSSAVSSAASSASKAVSSAVSSVPSTISSVSSAISGATKSVSSTASSAVSSASSAVSSVSKAVSGTVSSVSSAVSSAASSASKAVSSTASSISSAAGSVAKSVSSTVSSTVSSASKAVSGAVQSISSFLKF